MAGNSQRRGAVRKSGKGATVGSGGQRRKGLEGRGPTPKAVDREHHPAHKRATPAARRGAKAGAPARPAGGAPPRGHLRPRAARAGPHAAAAAARGCSAPRTGVGWMGGGAASASRSADRASGAAGRRARTRHSPPSIATCSQTGWGCSSMAARTAAASRAAQDWGAPPESTMTEARASAGGAGQRREAGGGRGGPGGEAGGGRGRGGRGGWGIST